jgi:GcrA cell cycle regulator
MEWAEETIVRLRALWDEGLSTAEIGRRLGVTKNAVVGKAHRLDLPARPSPIRPAGSGIPRKPHVPKPQPAPLNTLAPLASLSGSAEVVRLSAPPRVRQSPRACTEVKAPSPALPEKYGRVEPCCWPIGEPGTREFRYCSVDSLPGRPYCDQHAQLGYRRVKDRRDSDPEQIERYLDRVANKMRLAA